MTEVLIGNQSNGDILEAIRAFYKECAIALKIFRPEEALFLKCQFALIDRFPHPVDEPIPVYRSPIQKDGRIIITIYMKDFFESYIISDRVQMALTLATALVRNNRDEALDQLMGLLPRREQLVRNMVVRLKDIAWLIYLRMIGCPDVYDTETSAEAIDIRMDVDCEQQE